jgi:TolB-like protein
MAMRYLFTSLLLFVLLFTISYSEDKASIAVLELEPLGISENEAKVLSSRLRTELFGTENFTVLERDKMDEILKEQGFQLSGCTTNECVVEAGKLIGVEQMVAGNIAKIDNLYSLNIRLIDVETGKVLMTATEDCECQLKDVLINSIKKVSEILAGKKKQVEIYDTSKSVDNSKLSDFEMKEESKEEYSDYETGGLTEEQWKTYNFDKKGAFSQSVKSFIFPGWGQLSLDRKRGYTYIGIEIVTLAGAIYSRIKTEEWKDENDYWLERAKFYEEIGDIDNANIAWNKKVDAKDQKDIYEHVLFSIFSVSWLLNRLISAIDAGYTTPHYNEELKKKYKLSFTPKLNKYSNQPMLSININF